MPPPYYPCSTSLRGLNQVLGSFAEHRITQHKLPLPIRFRSVTTGSATDADLQSSATTFAPCRAYEAHSSYPSASPRYNTTSTSERSFLVRTGTCSRRSSHSSPLKFLW